MTNGQKKILVFIEGAVLGPVGGFAFGMTSLKLALFKGQSEAQAIWAISGLLIFILWFRSRMNGRVGGLDNLWRAIVGDEEKVSVEGYSLVEMEVESNEIDKELWSKALVKAKGNEELRKIEYMKLRVAQIKRQSR